MRNQFRQKMINKMILTHREACGWLLGHSLASKVFNLALPSMTVKQIQQNDLNELDSVLQEKGKLLFENGCVPYLVHVHNKKDFVAVDFTNGSAEETLEYIGKVYAIDLLLRNIKRFGAMNNDVVLKGGFLEKNGEGGLYCNYFASYIDKRNDFDEYMKYMEKVSQTVNKAFLNGEVDDFVTIIKLIEQQYLVNLSKYNCYSLLLSGFKSMIMNVAQLPDYNFYSIREFIKSQINMDINIEFFIDVKNNLCYQNYNLLPGKWWFISDIDGTFLSHNNEVDKEFVPKLTSLLSSVKQHFQNEITIAYATGRNLNSFKSLNNMCRPDYLIASVGTEIFRKEGDKFYEEKSWMSHLSETGFNDEQIISLLGNINGLQLQSKENLNKFKVSYNITEENYKKNISEIEQRIKNSNIKSSIIYSGNLFLDVLPYNCNKGKAISYLLDKTGGHWNNVITCGDSGNDIQMFEEVLEKGGFAIIVGNAKPELREWQKTVNENLQKRIIETKGQGPQSLIEGIYKIRKFIDDRKYN